MSGHKWYTIPSRFVARKWCTRCGCLAEGEQRGWFRIRWDWQYAFPDDPRARLLEHQEIEPPCEG